MSLRDRILKAQQELGIQPKKSLGQNFLIADHVVEKITKAVEDFSPKSVIEVGPGLGSLTHSLTESDKLKSAKFELIELDSVFAEYWRKRGFQLQEADALNIDWTALVNRLDKPCVFVSNLPYQISSRIVVDRSMEPGLAGMVLMFQKEVAQRMQAKCGDELYGFLSVVVQSFWSTRTVSEAGPRDFDPPPKVASRVLEFRPRENSIRRERYLTFLKAAFRQPRKLMASNLSSLADLKRDQIELVLKNRGLSEKSRAEELKVEDFLSIAHDLGYE